jgi:hypothetical protein
MVPLKWPIRGIKGRSVKAGKALRGASVEKVK